MRLLLLCLFSFALFASAGEDKLFYEVKRSHDRFPFPTELPQLKDRRASNFNWEAYLKAATSEADRVYRAKYAFESGYEKAGEGFAARDSVGEQAQRAHLASTELRAMCDRLIARYRKKVKDEAEILKTLNEFIAQSEAAMNLQVQLIGQSWGGSGAKVAWSEARMNALVNYYDNLNELGNSLDLQDLPD